MGKIEDFQCRNVLSVELVAAYSAMLMQGTLLKHIAEIDETCHSTLKDMMSKMAEQEGVTEQLKATNQMDWVQKMNSIKNRTEEYILKEYVYGGFDK